LTLAAFFFLSEIFESGLVLPKSLFCALFVSEIMGFALFLEE